MEKFLSKLEKVSLFNDIDKNDLKNMISCLDAFVKTFEKGNMIFLAGDKANKIGIVLSGFVKIIKEDAMGNQIIISELGECDIFGEVFACAEIEHIPVTVVASGECEIMFIDFKKVLYRCSANCFFHTKLIENMMKLLAVKNLAMGNKNDILSKKTIREKVLCYLEGESLKADSMKFEIAFSRNELADYLGVDRSALSRELSKMKEENIIDYNKNKFELKDYL